MKKIGIIKNEDGSYHFDLPGPYSPTPLGAKEDTLYSSIKSCSSNRYYEYHAIVEAVKRSTAPRGPELYDELSKIYGKYSRSVLLRVMRYDLYDELIPALKRAMSHAGYYQLNEEFQSVVDYYVQEIDPSHLFNRGVLLSSFFLGMQQKNIKSLNEISPQTILDYLFENPNDIRTKKKMANQLRRCGGLFQDGQCERIASYFPAQAGAKKEYQAFSPSEQKALIECICKSHQLTYLERAYGAIAITYGIRQTDIINLKHSNINWNTEKLQFIQKKTGQPYTIQLEPFVLNAVYDYIKFERPKTESDFIFLSQCNRAGKFVKINAQLLCKKIYEKAGINMSRGNLGTNQMRHTCAIQLLEKGADKSTISSILGHTCPTSVNAYIQMDISDIKNMNIDPPVVSSKNKIYGK